MAQQIALANENELTNQKAPEQQVSDYAQYLLANPEMAAQLVQFNAQIPTLNSKQNTQLLEILRGTLKHQPLSWLQHALANLLFLAATWAAFVRG